MILPQGTHMDSQEKQMMVVEYLRSNPFISICRRVIWEYTQIAFYTLELIISQDEDGNGSKKPTGGLSISWMSRPIPNLIANCRQRTAHRHCGFFFSFLFLLRRRHQPMPAHTRTDGMRPPVHPSVRPVGFHDGPELFSFQRRKKRGTLCPCVGNIYTSSSQQ